MGWKGRRVERHWGNVKGDVCAFKLNLRDLMIMISVYTL